MPQPIPKPSTMPDVTVENYGSIFLFQPRTTAGTVWLAEHVAHDALWWGPALAVEPRYAQPLAVAMLDDGLVLQ